MDNGLDDRRAIFRNISTRMATKKKMTSAPHMDEVQEKKKREVRKRNAV